MSVFTIKTNNFLCNRLMRLNELSGSERTYISNNVSNSYFFINSRFHGND